MSEWEWHIPIITGRASESVVFRRGQDGKLSKSRDREEAERIRSLLKEMRDKHT